MATDPNKELLFDLNFRTALLESLGWDETQFNSLLQYLQEVLSADILMPDDILQDIKANYGDEAHDLIKKMFVDVYIENGFYIKKEDDYEH